MPEHKQDDRCFCKLKQVDMISDLPDHILLTILDRLNVRDAIRTSVLSRRWRQLPAMLSQLVIHGCDFGACQYNDKETIRRTNTSVIQAAKSMLAHRNLSQNTIHMLSMAFFLRGDDPMIIGHVVGHTMTTHKVDLAKFFVWTERNICDDDDLINYGRQFMSFFHACTIAFGGLTHLHLENLRFGASDICNVLNTCKRLEQLYLFNCDSGRGSMLQVEHSQLIDLGIVYCSFERVELNSLPRLVRMIFEGWLSFQDPISFGDVPLLEVVSLANVGLSWHTIVRLSNFLAGTSLRELKLGFASEKIWVQPENLTRRLASVFHEITFVSLLNIPEGYDLTWTFFILEAAPNLKDLYLSVWDHLCVMETNIEKREAELYSENKGVEWEVPTSSFQHNNLATLAVFGFGPRDYMISYVRRVMEAAVNLEVVFLHGRPEYCDRCHIVPPKPSETESVYTCTDSMQYVVDNIITKGINSSATVQFETSGVLADVNLEKLYSL